MEQIKVIITKVVEIHQKLQVKNLKTQQKYDYLKYLEQLIHQKEDIAEQVLQNKDIIAIQQDLRNMYLDCVYELEKEYSMLLEKEPNIMQTLSEYAKYQHYKTAVHFEYALFQMLVPMQRLNLLLIGSGSLPLTAFMLLHNTDCSCTLMDKSSEALSLSHNLLRKLDFADRVNFIHSDVILHHDFRNFNCILVAHSVGQTQAEKQDVYQHILNHLQKHQIAIFRIQYLISKLLSPSIEFELNSTIFNISEATLRNSEDIVHRLVVTKK